LGAAQFCDINASKNQICNTWQKTEAAIPGVATKIQKLLVDARETETDNKNLILRGSRFYHVAGFVRR